MEIFQELNTNKGLSLALGFFDGVHIGHREVIKSAVDFAKENNTKSAIITFQDHPCCYFYDIQPKYIIQKHNKLKFLQDLGLDYVYFLKFDEYLAVMDASQYLHDVIIKNFAPTAISTGFNHFFGARKTGDVKLLCTLQNDFCYKYFEVKPVVYKNEIVSSTRIRDDLSFGNIEAVNHMLGYSYFIEEKVVHGEEIGRTIGFRTANLVYPDNLVEPGRGVYKVKVEHENKTYEGIANFGNRPTVNDNEKNILEVHILDFDKDIYGDWLKVTFLKKIRDEKKFNSLDELKAQIQQDIKA